VNVRTLFKISYGVYIVSSKKSNKLNGQIANTVFQVTAEPACIAVSINKENLTCEFIQDSKVFAVSILSENTPMEFIGKFGFKSGRDIDKFSDTNYKIGTTGAPVVLDYSVGYLECKVINSLDVGTHIIFVGDVIEAEILNDEVPMTYAYYHQIKRGKAPKTAPTYMKEE
jgi:flavin reductase (DIM6/NTAB) family NADH-FMN oxidoreductase RutF